jgi:hypothetical protein
VGFISIGSGGGNAVRLHFQFILLQINGSTAASNAVNKTTMEKRLILSLLCLGLILPVRGGTAHEGKPAAVAGFEKEIKPLLAQYCYGCHGEAKKKADLSLEGYQDESLAIKDRAVWEKVLHNVETREMPPENKPQPTPEQRAQITAWIEAKVFGCDCDHPDPGRVTLRRLNRAEYNNTIRDLVGIDFHPAGDFPADDSGYGFDNIGDALSMPPILFEKYLAAAGKIMDEAIVTGNGTSHRTNRFNAESLESDILTESKGNGWVVIGREGEMFTSVRFLASGDYLFRVRAYGEQAGTEPVRMALRVGGNEVKVFEVPGEQDSPRVFEQKITVSAGRTVCAVAFLNNFRDPKNPDRKRRDRNLVVDYIELEGPLNPKPEPPPESHQRIFVRRPAPDASLAEKLSCAREDIARFTRRAWRRPVAPGELERLVALAGMALKDGESFERSVQVALEAVLVSPSFLFRGELQPEPDNPGSLHRVDEYALASRLSYFLWSSMPDRELFDLAERGALRRNLEPQIRRMLRSDKARALVSNFGGQWLQVRNLDASAPDGKRFPAFDDALRAAMQTETELLFETILSEDRSVMEFVTADYTFVNGRLAHHYGMTNVTGEAFQRVPLAGTQRGGVLTHASILTLTSNPTRTSPVKRGKWILENILGTPPPPPPPNVPELKDSKQLTGTLRQRMVQHREDPTCASCHARMDPIGFSFEHFDAVGAWRETDENLPIDSTGKLVTGEAFGDPNDLRRIIATGRQDDFLRCLTRKMLTYALGRGLEYYDKCAVDEIMAGLKRRQCKFSALVEGIVRSTPFQIRRGEGDRSQVAASEK